MSGPTLSIVMPSYNQGKFIARALDSLVSQGKDGALEVIVQDAMSTDSTAAILGAFEQYPFVHIYREQDKGQSHAINVGFGKAKGKVLGWLNSDDVLLPGAVDKVIDTFESDPQTVLAYGEALFIDQSDCVLRAYPTGTPNLTNMMHRCVLSQPSCFFSRESLVQYGQIDETLSYCMDYEFWLRLLKKGVIPKKISATLSCTRIHGDTKTHNGGLSFISEIIAMQNDHFGKPSPIWKMYQKARTGNLGELQNKPMRFLLAGFATMLEEPGFTSSVLRSSVDRLCSNFTARRALKSSEIRHGD